MKRVIIPSVQLMNRAVISPDLLREQLRPWQGSPQLKAVGCLLSRINYAPMVSVKLDFYLMLTAGFSVPPHSCSRDLPDCASPPSGSQEVSDACAWMQGELQGGTRDG